MFLAKRFSAKSDQNRLKCLFFFKREFKSADLTHVYLLKLRHANTIITTLMISRQLFLVLRI